MFITSSLPFPPPPSVLPPFFLPPFDSPLDALALNKEMEFSAIQGILRHLDDNADGSVDLQESEEVHTLFARAEGGEGERLVWGNGVYTAHIKVYTSFVYHYYYYMLHTCAC